MGSQSPSHSHGLLAFHKGSGTPGQKELVLRRHKASHAGDPDGAPVKMPGQSKIRSPLSCLGKIKGGVHQKDLEAPGICISQLPLQIPFRHLYRLFQKEFFITGLRKIHPPHIRILI